MKIAKLVDLINKTLEDGGLTERVIFGIEASKNVKNKVKLYCKLKNRLVLSLCDWAFFKLLFYRFVPFNKQLYVLRKKKFY